MLRTFLSWWLEQMAATVPVRLRLRRRRQPDALLIDCRPEAGNGAEGGAGSAQLIRRRKGREIPLGLVALDALPAGQLRLPRGTPQGVGRIVLRSDVTALQRDVVLPAAAERDVAQVLRYDMDRLTPFEEAEVYWDWQIAARDPARGRVTIGLLVVPRAAVASGLAALRQAGLAPSRLQVRRPDGSWAELPLQHADRRSPRIRPQFAWGGAACLVLAVLAAPFIVQSFAAEAVDDQIATLRPRVAQVESLRRRLAARTVPPAVVEAERRRTGDALRALAGLTELLPDNTYLLDLGLHAHRITITGRSASAARLIPILSAGPLIADATFTAPTTREPGADRDSFALQAIVRP
jgi:general secretion pathway protein L